MKQSLCHKSALALLLSLLLAGCGGGGSDSAPEETIPSDPVPAELPEPEEEPAVSNSSLPVLVIRLAYSNRSFKSSAGSWSSRIFGKSSNQLNDYFREVSNGSFSFAPVAETDTLDGGSVNDGVITVTLNKEHPDPDVNERTKIHTDLAAALILASPYIDYSTYDSNGNGAISYNELQIIYIVAGYEDAYSGGTMAPGIWAHSYCLPSIAPELNGVTLLECNQAGRYSLFGERHYRSDSKIAEHDATIGIIAHELGHSAFGLPDLYDTDGSSAGIGYFGLMSTGSWGASGPADYPGNTPVHPCAWSKIESGWVTPQTVSSVNDAPVDIYQSSSLAANIVKVPVSGSEYFLLENRDNSGYDRGLYMLDGTFDGGLALWHIDETVIEAKDPTNTVNNDESRKGVDLEEASRAGLDITVESGGHYGHESNLYYAGNADAFTPATSPDSDSYEGGGSGIYVEGISSRGATMTATITNPNP
jgi:M6 family metalloprotease-like protein